MTIALSDILSAIWNLRRKATMRVTILGASNFCESVSSSSVSSIIASTSKSSSEPKKDIVLSIGIADVNVAPATNS